MIIQMAGSITRVLTQKNKKLFINHKKGIGSLSRLEYDIKKDQLMINIVRDIFHSRYQIKLSIKFNIKFLIRIKKFYSLFAKNCTSLITINNFYFYYRKAMQMTKINFPILIYNQIRGKSNNFL